MYCCFITGRHVNTSAYCVRWPCGEKCMLLERRRSEVGQLLTETAARAGAQAAPTSPFLFGAPPLGLRSAGHTQAALESLAQQRAPQQGSLQSGVAGMACFDAHIAKFLARKPVKQAASCREGAQSDCSAAQCSALLPANARPLPSRNPPALSAWWPCCARCCAAWRASTLVALLGRLVWGGQACCRPGLARGGCLPCLRPVHGGCRPCLPLLRGCTPCRLLRSRRLLADRVWLPARQTAGGGRAPHLHCKGLNRMEKRFEDEARQAWHTSCLGRASGQTASKAR